MRGRGWIGVLFACATVSVLTLPVYSEPAGSEPFDDPAVDSPPAAATAGSRAAKSGTAPRTRPTLFEALHQEAPRLDAQVLRLALDATACARGQNLGPAADSLVVIDYSLPSTRKRLWVFDLSQRKLLYRELVAHGKGSGENYAEYFSNTPGSLQTSLGLFLTGHTYQGKNGYSLRLYGLEPGINDLAFDRAIVIHGAWYVSEDFAHQHGRLGRSWGCPALRLKIARKVIDRIKDGRGLVFSYADAPGALDHSRLLDGDCSAGPEPVRVAAGSRTRR